MARYKITTVWYPHRGEGYQVWDMQEDKAYTGWLRNLSDAEAEKALAEYAAKSSGDPQL